MIKVVRMQKMMILVIAIQYIKLIFQWKLRIQVQEPRDWWRLAEVMMMIKKESSAFIQEMVIQDRSSALIVMEEQYANHVIINFLQ